MSDLAEIAADKALLQLANMWGDVAKFYTPLAIKHFADALDAFAAKAVTREVERREAAEARVAELEKLVYVPGVWRCAKCDLSLVSATLNATNGLVKANQEPQQCPNGCGPLWRVTERDAGNRLIDDMDKMQDELTKLRLQVTTLPEPLIDARLTPRAPTKRTHAMTSQSPIDFEAIVQRAVKNGMTDDQQTSNKDLEKFSLEIQEAIVKLVNNQDYTVSQIFSMLGFFMGLLLRTQAAAQCLQKTKDNPEIYQKAFALTLASFVTEFYKGFADAAMEKSSYERDNGV